ncbi:MAG: DUF2130 domain-containing protein, partial [Patescibacteria group bacterium]|nr:DUF2130 domain-containing protein [Patescibacteria group bacterium]
LKALAKEKDEEKERNRQLLKQLEDLTDQIRALRRKDEERELETKKRLAQNEARLKEELVKKFSEDHDLKDQEKEKVINDLKKALADAQRKAEQGSQQTQGEVLELELEGLLKKEFPGDEIKEVKKGQRGADVIQTVIDKRGQSCGVILWESKNAQWQEPWLKKLRQDQREAKAHLAVLVATDHPKEIGLFKFIDNVWVVDRKAVLNLAMVLRFNLVNINHERLMNVGKNEKMEVLYQYITGTEFTHRIEAIVESFTNLQSDIEKEKRWFGIKWARQEKEIRKVIDSTHGIYGELQAVSGRALQTIKQLE